MNAHISIADEIIKLKQLVDKGVISEADFEIQKSRLLKSPQEQENISSKPQELQNASPKKSLFGWGIFYFILAGFCLISIMSNPIVMLIDIVLLISSGVFMVKFDKNQPEKSMPLPALSSAILMLFVLMIYNLVDNAVNPDIELSAGTVWYICIFSGIMITSAIFTLVQFLDIPDEIIEKHSVVLFFTLWVLISAGLIIVIPLMVGGAALMGGAIVLIDGRVSFFEGAAAYASNLSSAFGTGWVVFCIIAGLLLGIISFKRLKE